MSALDFVNSRLKGKRSIAVPINLQAQEGMAECVGDNCDCCDCNDCSCDCKC